MTLEIPDSYQHVLNHAVASGVFLSPQDALCHAIELLANEQSLETLPASQASSDWEPQFRGWAANHPATSHMVNVDRESIYEGRGM